MEENIMKLNVKALALTLGLICGLGLFLITWWIILFEGTNTDLTMVSNIYRGYSVTPVGSLIGLIWASIDGAIGGACIAWIYNLFLPKNETV
jgi:hypothetical protein